MTDRELLELAARAHGGLVHVDGLGWIHEDENGNRGAWWRPLEDDGDAMRLAEALGLTVCMGGSASVSAGRYCGIFITQGISHDGRIAATRRAIVRAAAKIGESKRD